MKDASTCSIRLTIAACAIALCVFACGLLAAAPRPAFAAGDLTAQSKQAIDAQALSEIESVTGQVTQVALGDTCSAALLYDGALWMWGYDSNSSGVLGNSTTPVKVLTGVKQVALGSKHAAALKTDGTLWMWGSNSNGQIGVTGASYYKEPVKVLSGVRQVALGSSHSGAVKTDGTLWMWGANGGGQLGDGTTVKRTTPVRVLSGVKEVELGQFHSAALKTDGSLWAWGSNNSGQVGNGSNASTISSPVRVMTGVSDFSLGLSHSAAVTRDGKLWMWGSNTVGQLGDNSTTNSRKPKDVQMANVKMVELGGNHSAAIRTDNHLWMWGSNSNGQLGYDTLGQYRAQPATTIRDGVVTGVALGAGHSAAIKSGGSLWMWGLNKNAQLGFGSTTDVNAPKQLLKGGVALLAANVTVLQPSFTYTGSACKPAVKVTNGVDTLKAGTHYQVAYQSNTNAGTARVVVTGIGYFAGSVTKTFTITAASMSKVKVSLSKTTYAYNGKDRKPSATAKLGSKKLKSGTDYTVTYSKSPKAVGTYKVKLTGKGNMSGSITKSYKVVPQASAIQSVAALRSSKSGAASVSWKKVSSQCSGYELVMSPSKKYTGSGVVKTTFSAGSKAGKNCSFRGGGLRKGTKYYVKVRTYKKAGGKTYYSSWSKSKTFTTLK